jgi:hypothetical protein
MRHGDVFVIEYAERTCNPLHVVSRMTTDLWSAFKAARIYFWAGVSGSRQRPRPPRQAPPL